MRRRVLLQPSVPLVLVVLSACKGGDDPLETAAPARLTLDAEWVELGEVAIGETATGTLTLRNEGGVPLGIGEITVDDDAGAGFTVSWELADARCEGDGRVAEYADEVRLTLDPGCALPVTVSLSPTTRGEVYAAIKIPTVGDAADTPSFWADPLHAVEQGYVHATALDGYGRLLILGGLLDFAPAALGEEQWSRLTVRNQGDSALTFEGYTTIGDDCAAFEVGEGLEAGERVDPGEETVLDIAFTPLEYREHVCALTVFSDDPVDGTQSITLRALSTCAVAEGPSVKVLGPETGTIVTASKGLDLNLRVTHEHQDASTLTCLVKSGADNLNTVAACAPPSSEAAFEVAIPVSKLEDGPDTLVVEVYDLCGRMASASLPIAVNSGDSDDDDGDGWGEKSGDCDDNNAAVYPFAAEAQDGLDNDCDGGKDDGTDAWDDDEDGFSEDDGDCDDNNNKTYPGAAEPADGLDNDCDDEADEGTIRADDDGDGFSEEEGDCNDLDPIVAPGAAEICDGLDQNCDDLADNDLLCGVDAPWILGDVDLSQTACELGEEIVATTWAVDPQGTAITYTWNLAPGLSADSLSMSTITLTCASTLPASAGDALEFTSSVVVSDPEGHQSWAFGSLWVWQTGALYQDVVLSGADTAAP
ncbi:MAG: hypothetical protein RIT28_1559 [Pseudomonadota bacterium]|jgi:hypothetical protein